MSRSENFPKFFEIYFKNSENIGGKNTKNPEIYSKAGKYSEEKKTLKIWKKSLKNPENDKPRKSKQKLEKYPEKKQKKLMRPKKKSVKILDIRKNTPHKFIKKLRRILPKNWFPEAK